jgi:hypothetical protein
MRDSGTGTGTHPGTHGKLISMHASSDLLRRGDLLRMDLRKRFATGSKPTCPSGACIVLWNARFYCGANGEGRTPMAFRPPDPKSGASASSATFA